MRRSPGFRLGLLTPWLLAICLAVAPSALAERNHNDAELLASAIVEQAPVEIKNALSSSLRRRMARAALINVLRRDKVDAHLLTKAVHNPFFAPYVADTLIDLTQVQGVPGVERVNWDRGQRV